MTYLFKPFKSQFNRFTPLSRLLHVRTVKRLSSEEVLNGLNECATRGARLNGLNGLNELQSLLPFNPHLF